MSEVSNPLARCDALRRLEEINHFLLHDEGEILQAPGKISLVWTDPVRDQQRYLAIKVAGEDLLLINGRRYPATPAGLMEGLRGFLGEIRRGAFPNE